MIDATKKTETKEIKGELLIQKKQRFNPLKLRSLKQPQSIVSLIPFRRIINEDCIQMKGELVTDYLQFTHSNAKNNHEDIKHGAIINFASFLRSIRIPCKIVFASFPYDMDSNISYLDNRLKQEEFTPALLEATQLERNRLSQLQDKLQTEIYLQIFAKNKETLAENLNQVYDACEEFAQVQPMSIGKKVKLIHRLFNMGGSPIHGEPYTDSDETGRSPEIEAFVKKYGYDPIFISQIQPAGNITPKSDVIQTGDGYLKVLHIYQYKRMNNRRFWGDSVFKFSNVVSTIDIKTIDKNSVLFETSLNRSLSEFADRVETSRDAISRKKAIKDYQSLDAVVSDIIDNDEEIKEIRGRLYIHEPTMEALIDKETYIKRRIKKAGVHVTTYLEETKEEYLSLFLPYEQQTPTFKRKGQEIHTFSLAHSYPLNMVNLVDPTGLYLGYTLTGNGIVCLDLFHKDKFRKSYSSVYIGGQGSGKSALAKFVAKHNRIMGNTTYMLMVSDEAEEMATQYGGKSLDARSPKINPMQIYATDIDSKTGDTLEKESYHTNLSKIKAIYILASGLSDASTTENTFDNYLSKFYSRWLKEKNLSLNKITQYAPEEYPLFEHLRDYIKVEQEKVEEEFLRKELYDILSGLNKIVESNGEIFNCYTENNFEMDKLVAIDSESLLAKDSNVYNAQTFNMLNMFYSLGLKRGQREKYLYETGQKKFEEIEFTTILIDEFHNLVRNQNKFVLKQLDKWNREGRKVFNAISFIIHDINDCFIDMNDGQMGEISKAVVNLFKLTTYRFIFEQDTSSLDQLRLVFGSQISETDLNNITKLETGETHLNIKGLTNIQLKVDLPKKDIDLFRGGA